MGDFIDLTSQIMGYWEVLEKDQSEEKRGKGVYWICKCLKCNKTIKSIRSDHLRSGASTSCGCQNKKEKTKKETAKNKFKGKHSYDLTSQIFGELTVLKYSHTQAKTAYWICECSCGKIVIKSTRSLKQGQHPSCGHYKKPGIATQAHDLTGQIFNYLEVLYFTEKRASNGSIIWKCRCLNCGTEIEVSSSHLKDQISCGCINSKGEYYIKKILNENEINFITQYGYEDLKGKNNIKLKYDFYLPDYNKLIEFDGEQHYNALTDNFWYHDNSFDKRQKYDKIKNEYALSNNIPLVRIPYWERDNITLDMLLGDKYLVKDINDYGTEEIIF